MQFCSVPTHEAIEQWDLEVVLAQGLAV